MKGHLEEFFDKLISVKFSDDKKSVDIIDQTLLPVEIKRTQLSEKEEIWDAIKKLRVRGAPAIGVFAACGLAVLAEQIATEEYKGFYQEFMTLHDYLATSRPTAVNLFWALNRMKETVQANKDNPIKDIKQALFEKAEQIRQEDIAISRNIGVIGFDLIK